MPVIDNYKFKNKVFSGAIGVLVTYETFLVFATIHCRY